jgi:glycosyltransferase involved in cell wall biosynthesis
MPILLFVHGDEVWNVAIHRSKRWYEPFLLRALTRVASVSQFTIDVMAREFDVPLPKFRLLPNAVDPLPVSRGDASEASHQRDPFTILTVSRLGVGDREKYVDKVIEAVARLKKILPEVRYEIVGDGVLRSELEALAKDLGVDDVVRFRGRVDDAELHQAYARAAVFAMPSSKEGFGIVYLEAWQRGLPVVCSSEGAAKEVVSDGIDGFVVDPKDISALADKLHLLLSKPELAKSFGENGRRKVEEKYLNPAFRANLDRIIDEIRQL